MGTSKAFFEFTFYIRKNGYSFSCEIEYFLNDLFLLFGYGYLVHLFPVELHVIVLAHTEVVVGVLSSLTALSFLSVYRGLGR